MKKMRYINLIWMVGIGVMTIHCAEDRALIITGQTMVTLADTFVATSAAMDKGYEDKVITQSQYDQWAKFGRKFQQTYPLALHLWQLAEDHKDEVMQAQLVSVVMGMSTDLAAFTALIKGK